MKWMIWIIYLYYSMHAPKCELYKKVRKCFNILRTHLYNCSRSRPHVVATHLKTKKKNTIPNVTVIFKIMSKIWNLFGFKIRYIWIVFGRVLIRCNSQNVYSSTFLKVSDWKNHLWLWIWILHTSVVVTWWNSNNDIRSKDIFTPVSPKM